MGSRISLGILIRKLQTVPTIREVVVRVKWDDKWRTWNTARCHEMPLFYI